MSNVLDFCHKIKFPSVGIKVLAGSIRKDYIYNQNAGTNVSYSQFEVFNI